jgi:hypothetical protein
MALALINPVWMNVEQVRERVQERLDREREARMNEMYKGVPKYKQDGGGFTDEYCDLRIAENNEKIAQLKTEIAHRDKIIFEKWKGYIRSAQKERREMREQIDSLRRKNMVLNNNGIW